MNTVLIGMLFLGMFVGYLLSLTLRIAAKPTTKSVLKIIAGALSGAPILFMQDAGSAKWAYPVGLVLGLMWVQLGASIPGRQKQRRGVAKLSSWKELALPGAISALVVIGFAFLPERSAADNGVLVERDQMPCRWAWVYLGRFSRSRANYELPEGFRYDPSSGQRNPVPMIGDTIITTRELSLLVSNYGMAAPANKCDSILDPPWSYRPENASTFKAGTLPSNTRVLVNLVTLMPNADADPFYVWALVGSPE